MKKYLYLLSIPILLHLAVSFAAAMNVFQYYEKVIWINQHKQVGEAYENGKKLFEFPVITGDDETTTNPGIYLVKLKVEDYYSKKYDTAMPYSIFFDLKERKAIHGGEVPSPAAREEWATHGCVHVEMPYIERLFDWAEEGKTAVVIQGWRDED
jgi:lipoprotein-anchoring transpeptidase ErfK/SrfK